MPRVEFEGAVYHVLCRGNRREAIFRCDRDRELFFETLKEACGRTSWQVHAVVLMSNHYHLLLETPEPNLVRGMHWFQVTYTTRFNVRHRLAGHVFGGRYKALPIDPQERGHFATVSDYIHLNPARAGIAEAGNLAAYPWSSLKWYGAARRKRPAWLEVETVLGEFGFADRAGDRRRYVARMEERTMEGAEAGDSMALKRGWILGGEAFRDRVLEMMEGECGGSQLDRAFRRDHGERRAERLVSEGVKLLALEEADLARLPKNDWRKRLIAHCVKKETSVSLAWMGKRLRMGTEAYVSRMSSRLDDLAGERDVRQWLERLQAILTR